MYEKPVILTAADGQRVAGILRESPLAGQTWLVLHTGIHDPDDVRSRPSFRDVWFHPDAVDAFAEATADEVAKFNSNTSFLFASRSEMDVREKPPAHAAGPGGAAPAGPPTPEGMRSFLEKLLRENGMGHIGVGDVQVIQAPAPGGERVCDCPGCRAKRAAAEPSEAAKATAAFADHVSKAPHDGCVCPACARARFEQIEANNREFDKLTEPVGPVGFGQM